MPMEVMIASRKSKLRAQERHFLRSLTRSRTFGLPAVDRDLEGQADLSHSHAAQRTDPFDEHGG